MLSASQLGIKALCLPSYERVNDFVKELTPEQQSFVKRLADATFPIFENGEFVGNGIAITSNLLLTSSNCGTSHNLHLETPREEEDVPKNYISASVIFEAPESHFKILLTDFPSLECVPLGSDFKAKEGIQIHANPKTDEKIVKTLGNENIFAHYLSAYQSPRNSPRHSPQQHTILSPWHSPLQPPILSPRHSPQQHPLLSPRQKRIPANESVDPTEIGAPAMALKDGRVYAIRYNDFVSVKISDVYANLQRALANDRNVTASSILNSIGDFDADYVEVDIWQLERDLKTDKKQLFKKTTAYGFSEVDKNVIKIWPGSKIYEHQRYDIHPSPNDDQVLQYFVSYLSREGRAIDQSSQNLTNLLFKHFTKYVGREWLATGQPPKNLSAKVFGIEYTLTLAPPDHAKIRVLPVLPEQEGKQSET